MIRLQHIVSTIHQPRGFCQDLRECSGLKGTPTEVFGGGDLFHILVFLDNLLTHIGELCPDLTCIDIDFGVCSFNTSLNRFGSSGCRIGGGGRGDGGGGGQTNKAK